MQLKLEEVLRDKGGELRLHQRFLDLRDFCEVTLSPLVDFPLKQHAEDLKTLIEKIIPEPKDRTEEMFSGEIFTLLGAIYLHDIGLVEDYEWDLGGKALSNIDSIDKRMLVNYGIGKRLGIPETAIEIINYLIFSKVLKKTPVEWEIAEDNRKAIIRNARLISHVFSFAHLILDVFYSDLRFKKLRRFNDGNFMLRSVGDPAVDVDSREGIIYIKYNANFPHELHVLNNAKNYVEDFFNLFKKNVNGKLGFNYRTIIWDITSNFSYEKNSFEALKFSPYLESEDPPIERWDKASEILDKIFNFGNVITIGDIAVGKTTVLRSFVVPQLLSVSPNVFYCELWDKPVSEIKDIICRRLGQSDNSELDITSLCKKLLGNGPCFFILDNCERHAYLNANEQSKLDRFIMFCLEHEDVYLIVSGDKATFFEWYTPFNGINMSTICEIKPIDGTKAIDAYGEETIFWDTRGHYKPIECSLLQRKLSLEKVLEDVLKSVKDEDDFRKIVAAFVDRNEKHLVRYTLEDVFFETAIAQKKALACITILKEKDILKEFELMGQVYYALSGKYLKEPLYRVLRLADYEEKRKIRNILKNSIINETLLDKEALLLTEKWTSDMIFSKEEMGLILASLILQSMDYTAIFEKAGKDGGSIDIQPILRLLYVDDPEKRRNAIELLVKIQDKKVINPLLAHLKREDVFEIKDLLIRGIGLKGKKRTIVAIMDVLKEIGDRQLKLRAIEFFYLFLSGNVKHILTEIREIEEDPIVLMKIEGLLSVLREI